MIEGLPTWVPIAALLSTLVLIPLLFLIGSLAERFRRGRRRLRGWWRRDW